MILLRVFLIISFLNSWSLTAQQDKEVSNLIRDAFHEKKSPAYWQLKFAGHTESGEKLRLFMAYDEKEYICYIISGNGKQHLFEGPYKQHKLEWVEYDDDRIRGFLRGLREEGMISAEWSDRDHKEGTQVFLIQENQENASLIPSLGAFFIMNGKLHNRDCELVVDWHLDGRLEVLMYTPGSLTPERFSKEGHLAARKNWTFHSPDSTRKLSIPSPLRNRDIKLRHEPDNATFEFGELEILYTVKRIHRRDLTNNVELFEFISTGKPSLDKKIAQSAESWADKLNEGEGERQIWFELTDYHDQLLFGQWWEESGNASVSNFKSTVIDLKDGRVMDIEEIVKVSEMPIARPSGHQLIMKEGNLCWKGQKDRIVGSETTCVKLSENSNIIHRKYKERFTQKS